MLINLNFRQEGLKLREEVGNCDLSDEQKNIFMEQIKALKDPKDDLKRVDI